MMIIGAALRSRRFGTSATFSALPLPLVVGLFISLFLFCFPALGQNNRPPAGVGGDSRQGEANKQAEQDKDELPDTSKIFFFYADNPTQIFPKHDSLLGDYFQQMNPARRMGLEYFTLGMPGTAAYPAFYETQMHKGFDVGLHAFDIYLVETNRIPYYPGLQKAYSEFSYSAAGFGSAGQSDGALKAKFSRNFKNGFNFSFDYKRVFNYSAGQQKVQGFNYNIPRNRIIALGGGMWYHSPNEKYDSYTSYTSNVITPLDNGGYVSDSVLKYGLDTNKVAQNVPTHINQTAVGRYESQEYSYLQYYKLNAKDTLKTSHKKRNYLLSLQTSYTTSKYKYYDRHTTSDATGGVWTAVDSNFYGNLLTDTRGLRYDVQSQKFENTFRISTTSANVSRDSFKKVTVKTNDWFELGLTHQIVNVQQEPMSFSRNNLIAMGRWNFTPTEVIKMETYAHLNLLGSNIGDYRISGDAYLNVRNVGSLKLSAVNQLYAPNLIQERLYVSQQPIWNNGFNKTLETHFSGSLGIEKTLTELTASYTLLNNYIYFDSLAHPQQYKGSVSVLQLIARQNFHVWGFHLDNTVGVQKIIGDVLPLPGVYSQNSLYWEGKVFKKAMLLRVGMDFRYHDSWFAYNYMPLSGQFFIQRRQEVPAYPLADFFLSVKVQTLRIFLKMENVYPYLNSTGTNVNYDVYSYPTPDRVFRFGFTWKLSN